MSEPRPTPSRARRTGRRITFGVAVVIVAATAAVVSRNVNVGTQVDANTANIAQAARRAELAASEAQAAAEKATRTARRAARTCGVLAFALERSKAELGQPGTAAYAFFQDHPEALADARAESQRLIDELNCKPLEPRR